MNNQYEEESEFNEVLKGCEGSNHAERQCQRQKNKYPFDLYCAKHTNRQTVMLAMMLENRSASIPKHQRPMVLDLNASNAKEITLKLFK